MYINFSLAAQKNLKPEEIIVLQLISQNRTEDLSQTIQNNVNIAVLSRFKELGLTEHVKAKNKSQTGYNTIRLSKRGRQILEDIQVPEIREDDLIFFSWLAAKYRETEREIGNAKKTKLWIALFRVNSGIEKNNLASLCNHFLEDEENFLFSKRLEYLFFKPATMYEKFDIEQSRLYQYYLNRKEYFDNLFSLSL